MRGLRKAVLWGACLQLPWTAAADAAWGAVARQTVHHPEADRASDEFSPCDDLPQTHLGPSRKRPDLGQGLKRHRRSLHRRTKRSFRHRAIARAAHRAGTKHRRHPDQSRVRVRRATFAFDPVGLLHRCSKRSATIDAILGLPPVGPGDTRDPTPEIVIEGRAIKETEFEFIPFPRIDAVQFGQFAPVVRPYTPIWPPGPIIFTTLPPVIPPPPPPPNPVISVPEPSAWTLVVTGFAFAGTALRRKQRGRSVLGVSRPISRRDRA